MKKRVYRFLFVMIPIAIPIAALWVLVWLPWVSREEHLEQIIFSYLIVVFGGLAAAAYITWLQEKSDKLRRQKDELSQNHSLFVSYTLQGDMQNELINQMGYQLQNCSSMTDASKIISQKLQKLFPVDVGALYLLDPVGHTFSEFLHWGGSPLHSDKRFTHEDCLAICNSKVRFFDGKVTSDQAICSHVSLAKPPQHLCIPMASEDRIVGLFYLEKGPDAELMSQPIMEKRFAEAWEKLATSIAERLSLSLENIKLREIIRWYTFRDEKTSLSGRYFLHETLKREMEISHESQNEVGLVRISISHFNDLIQKYSEKAMEQVQSEVGALIRQNIRSIDIASCYSPGFFIIILISHDRVKTVKKAQSLQAAIEGLLVGFHNTPIRVETEIGYSVYPGDGITAESLIARAMQ
jgi:diguanylate cyclase (GGDEF)-like protein